MSYLRTGSKLGDVPPVLPADDMEDLRWDGPGGAVAAATADHATPLMLGPDTTAEDRARAGGYALGPSVASTAAGFGFGTLVALSIGAYFLLKKG